MFSAVTYVLDNSQGGDDVQDQSSLHKGHNKTLVVGIALFALVILGVFVAHMLPVTVLQVGSYEFNLPKGVTVDMNTPGLVVEKNTVASILVSMRVTGNGEMRFLIGDDVVGGIEIIGYKADLPLFLPNHSTINAQKDVQGLLTEAVLLNLEITPPAASSETWSRNENHLYLIFEEQELVYDVFGDSSRLSESDLVEIAYSFKPAPDYEVRDVVIAFGEALTKVYKNAPHEVFEEQAKENYGPYVSEELLAKWLDEPSEAPGRYVSSPWPERIEIKDVTEAGHYRYEVMADIVEVTTGEGSMEDAWRIEIVLTVDKIDGRWLITDLRYI